MTQADFDDDAIDWDQTPPEPVVHWQKREPTIAASEAVAGLATLLVFTLGTFALGLLVADRMGGRSLRRFF